MQTFLGSPRYGPAATVAQQEPGCPVLASWAGFVSGSWRIKDRRSGPAGLSGSGSQGRPPKEVEGSRGQEEGPQGQRREHTFLVRMHRDHTSKSFPAGSQTWEVTLPGACSLHSGSGGSLCTQSRGSTAPRPHHRAAPRVWGPHTCAAFPVPPTGCALVEGSLAGLPVDATQR